MSFFNRLLTQGIQAAESALRSPAASTEGPAFVFDDAAASTVDVEPPSRILEHAIQELQQMGEGKWQRKLDVSPPSSHSPLFPEG